MNRIVTAVTGVAFVVTASAAFAQEHRRPPQEALTACSGLAAGTACAFTFRGENLTGTCAAPPGETDLACRPAGMKEHRGPPVEAITACTSKAANAACSFTTPDGKALNGTCGTPPEGSTLACRPEGHGPGGRGRHHGPPPEAFTACANASVDQACSVTHDGKTIAGTCAAPPDGGNRLACRPTSPPPAAAP